MQRGVFCSDDLPIRVNQRFAEAVGSRFFLEAGKEIKRLGYARDAEQSAFESRSPASAADYELAASVKAMALRICTSGLHDNAGEAWVQLKWELFSPKLQRVVLSVTSEGSYEEPKKGERMVDDFFDRVFSSALRNALADPVMAARLKMDPGAPGSDTEAPKRELLGVLREVDPQDGQDAHYNAQRSAVATLFSGTGKGSGFYVSTDGHLLTNHHVVGDDKYVKVRLPSGRELVGEVLRTDRPRDMALVKTEPVALRPIPVARKAPAVGEEVIAIGSPLGEQFAATLTRGVVSGVTTLESRRYVQSDAKLAPGNSGGPLLKKDGSVIAVVSRFVGPSAGVGVNLYVPIDDAAQALGLDFKP